ncbi:unnamed protein product [Sphagnum troendelagicum]|jgi:hypothetical protein
MTSLYISGEWDSFQLELHILKFCLPSEGDAAIGIDQMVMPDYFLLWPFVEAKKWLMGRLAHQEPRLMRRRMPAYRNQVVVVGLVLAVFLPEAQATMHTVRGSNYGIFLLHLHILILY